MAHPLDGIRVFDLTIAANGPWSTKLLGALGADVIKVEEPAGELSHQIPPPIKGDGVLYICANHNKRNIVLDLKNQNDLTIAYRLLTKSDVFVANMRPGVVDRLGFGYEIVSQIRPDIIYCTATAYGERGPMGSESGFETTVQAFSGLCSITGQTGERGEFFRHLTHIDFTTSCVIVEAILQALVARQRTGKGQKIDIEMLAAAAALQTSRFGEYFVTGAQPPLLGSAAATTAPHQAFLCQDKKYLAVGVTTEEQWARFCRAMKLGQLANDPLFKANQARVKNRAALIPLLEERFRRMPARWWHIQLTKEHVPNSYFLDFEDLRFHPQVVENEYLPQIDTPNWGNIYMDGLPWSFSLTPAGPTRPSGRKGQHTAEVLAELKLTEGGIPEVVTPIKGTNVTGDDPRNNTGALSQLRVVELTAGFCGSFAAMQLGDAGAEVIKVEPVEGDYLRKIGPFKNGESGAFLCVNRNKKSIVVDFTKSQGRSVLTRLIRTADILIEDLGPGEAEKLGLGYEDLSKNNPGLVYCAISPFGEKGPYKNLPGAELVVQAMAEYCSSLGTIGGSPVRWGADVGSFNTALFAFQAITAALLYRLRSGQGQRVAVSMLGSLMHLRSQMWHALSDPDDWFGFHLDHYVYPPSYGYQTKDGPFFFALRRGNTEQWDKLMLGLGMEEYLTDPRFAEFGRDATGVGQYSIEVMPIWEKAFATRTREELRQLVVECGGDAVPINNYEEFVSHPQSKALGLFPEIRHPSAGSFKTVRPVADLSETPMTIKSPPPLLGEHTDQVLSGIGLAAPEIQNLRNARILT